MLLGHVLMENRIGLVVDVSVSEETGTAEREESHKLLQVNAKKWYRKTGQVVKLCYGQYRRS